MVKKQTLMDIQIVQNQNQWENFHTDNEISLEF